MVRLTILLFIVAAAYGTWFYKRIVAKKRLREIDEGKRCVACDAVQMSVEGRMARCLRCGHVADIAAYQAAFVGSDEIANITRPDDRRY